ncbi:Retrovirus-related Pol polyprotein from transposon TNT 1-94 [Gossypium australe]|uniref:Retrovirus-related Pol polyprotein from transposon TNT 1-94 n=1 Tax=Gossypium australe TaxID=47621 RepID=A0A5B6WTZ3_9ROSI|nr:Retrovirus-related Pol polyprotein from transposon TNT 1-94 [Gossypium australe]
MRVRCERERKSSNASLDSSMGRDMGWRSAMQREVQALEANDKWTMESLPPRKEALSSKWVYKIKYNFDDTFEILKARLVVFDNH